MLNTGVSVANGFDNSTRFEGVVEEVVVVWGVLIGDGFDHLRKILITDFQPHALHEEHLLAQNTPHNCSHRGELSKEES